MKRTSGADHLEVCGAEIIISICDAMIVGTYRTVKVATCFIEQQRHPESHEARLSTLERRETSPLPSRPDGAAHPREVTWSESCGNHVVVIRRSRSAMNREEDHLMSTREICWRVVDGPSARLVVCAMSHIASDGVELRVGYPDRVLHSEHFTDATSARTRAEELTARANLVARSTAARRFVDPVTAVGKHRGIRAMRFASMDTPVR
jgi:hypothetical protein